MTSRKNVIIGAALIAAGAIVTATGANVSEDASAVVLTILGAGLVAAGLAVTLRTVCLTRVQAIVVSAALIVCGTVTASFAASAHVAEVRLAMTPLGGAIFIAGIIQLVLGVSAESPRLITD